MRIFGLIKNIFCIALIMFLVNGCSDDDGEGPLATPESAKTGNFRDEPVTGLGYSSPSWSGITAESGAFYYQEGQNITFFIGNTVLGTTPAKKNVTPVDLVPNADATNPTVINICRFLQSLDDNNNPDDGIVITDAVRQALAEFTVDFTNGFDESAQAILDELCAREIFEPGRTLVSADEARQRLEATIDKILAEELAAEDIEFAAVIDNPGWNAIVIQGQSLDIRGTVVGGTPASYSWTIGESTYAVEDPGRVRFGTPGNYAVRFTVTDTDGNTASDESLITVWEKALYGSIPSKDLPINVFIARPEDPTFAVGEGINLKAEIKKGNPPFYYQWTYPGEADYSFAEDPLDAVFTFDTPGVYTILIHVRDSYPEFYDTWHDSVTVKVE